MPFHHLIEFSLISLYYIFTHCSLDPEWKAKVSRTNGSVYFIHVPTGVSQKQVPPGFADIDKSEVNSDGSALANDSPDQSYIKDKSIDSNGHSDNNGI